MTTDQILAARKIDNPSDAALVRVVAAALTLPDEHPDTLCRRVGLTNPDDQTVAAALVDSVKAHVPRQQGRGVLIAALAILVVGLGIVGTLLVRSSVDAAELRQALKDAQATAASERQRLQSDFASQLDTIRKDLADSQARTGARVEGSLDNFAKTVAEQAQRITDLVRENEELRQKARDAQSRPSGGS